MCIFLFLVQLKALNKIYLFSTSFLYIDLGVNGNLLKTICIIFLFQSFLLSQQPSYLEILALKPNQ